MALSGTVSVPSGATITASGFTVTAIDLSNWSSTGVTATVAATGAYTFTNLTPGRYALRFDVPATSGLVGEWYNDKTGRYSADVIDLSTGASRTGVDVTLSRPASIAGTVSVPAGASAAGISVSAYDPANGWASSATTDAAGRYTLSGLTASSYRLSFNPTEASGLMTEWYADKPDFSTATAITVGSDETRTGTDAALALGASLSGRIIVPTGVTITPYSFRVVAYDPQQRWVGNTYAAADGAYRLSGLAAGTYRLQIDAPSESNLMDEWYLDAADFASARALTVAAGEARTGLDATLGSGASVSGKVSVPADLGADLTNVRVEVSTDDYRNSSSATVASDGTYKVGGLAAGTYRVRFVPGYGSTLAPEWWDDKPNRESSTGVDVGTGAQRTGVDATLARGASISGTVSASAGQSVSGAQVSAYTGEYTSVAWASVGSDGTYRFSGLQPGSYRLRFSPAQGSPLMSEWYSDKTSFASADALTVASGDVRNGIDASLAVGGSISGVVTVPSGMTVGSGPSAIRVSAQSDGGAYSGTSTTVASDGRYTVSGLSSGTYRVLFDAPPGSGLVDEWYDDARSYNSSAPVAVTGGATRTGVNAALAAGTSISGRVTLPAGVTPDSMQYSVSAYGDDYTYVAGTQIAADGSYTLSNLPPGSYRLNFSAPAGSGVLGEWYSDKSEYWTADAVTVTLDAPRTGLDVELAKAASFSGRIVSDAGTGLAQATVTAYRRVATGWQFSASAQTDAQGVYMLSGLTAGSYTLQFHPPASTGLLAEWWSDARDQAAATVLTLSSGQSTSGLMATLDRGATVTGTVRYSSGSSVAGAGVTVLDRAGTQIGSATTDASGRYSVSGLDPIAVTVGAIGAGGMQLEGGASTLAAAPSRTLTRGSTTTVDLSLTGRTVSGTVRIAGSTTPFTSGTVTLSSAVNADGVSAVIGADGKYRLLAVPAGSYVARVESTDAAYVTTWSDAAASEEDADYFRVASSNVTKNLTVNASATLTGTTDAAAGSWPWVQVLRWNGFAFEYVDGRSVPAGSRFTFAGLAPGQYAVRIGDVFHGGQSDPARATRIALAAGASTDIGVFQSVPSDAGALRGVIAGEATAPVTVTVTDSSGSERSTPASSVDGVRSWSFAALPAGTYTVRAESRGFPVVWFGGSSRTTSRGVAVIARGTAQADMTLVAGSGTVSGTVTRGGVVARGAAVSLVETGPDGRVYGSASTATASDGGYRFAGLLVPGRTYRVGVSGESGTLATRSEFVAVSGVQKRDLAVTTPGALRGTIVDEKTGAAVANAPLQAFRDGSDDPAATARTDSAGRYTLEGLAPGLYRVQFGVWSGDFGGFEPSPSAYAPEWLPDAATAASATPLRVTSGATATAPTLKVGSAGVVSGRVSAKLASGAVVWLDDAVISIRNASGAIVVSEQPRSGEAPGAYSVGVAPGTYTVCAALSPWADGAENFPRTCTSQKVVVTAGKRSTAPEIQLIETRPVGSSGATAAVSTPVPSAAESTTSPVRLLPDWAAREWRLALADVGAVRASRSAG